MTKIIKIREKKWRVIGLFVNGNLEEKLEKN